MGNSTIGGESSGNSAGGLLFPDPVTAQLMCSVDEYRLPEYSTGAAAEAPERASDSDHVSDQASDDVRFELSPDDVKRFGLTALEQIRHKYTGELPDRAVQQNRRTRIDQSRRSSLPYGHNAKTEDALEAEMLPPPLLPDEEFGPEDFTGFKESLISSLGYISGQIQRAAGGLCEADDIRQLAVYAASWRRTYHRQFLKEVSNDQDIHAAAIECQSLVTSVMASGSLTVEIKS